MPAEKQESGGRSVASDPGAGRTNGGDNAGAALGQQASQAIEGLRSVVEQASQVLRDLTQAGSQWVQNTDRAREMAQGLRVQGELELMGQRRPVQFELTISDDGKLTGSATVKQSDWGIKLYSILFGTVKVADEVEVTIAGDLSN